jgi:hypothetical protein
MDALVRLDGQAPLDMLTLRPALLLKVAWPDHSIPR